MKNIICTLSIFAVLVSIGYTLMFVEVQTPNLVKPEDRSLDRMQPLIGAVLAWLYIHDVMTFAWWGVVLVSLWYLSSAICMALRTRWKP